MQDKTIDNKYNEKELTVLYHKMGLGDIAQTYTREQEKPYYTFVCKKIENRYPNLVSAKELEELISNNGRIVSIGSVVKNGFYDSRRNITAIGHYLNRISTYLVHEFVHKISFFMSKGKIENLPNVYKEAGTELVSTESTKTKDTVGYIFGNVWAKMPNTITDYYLEYSLVNQLNFLAGNEAMERTILCGENCFEDRLKEIFGEKGYQSITDVISRIAENFREYSVYHRINSKSKNEKLKESLLEDIDSVQTIILRKGFDDRISKVQNIEEANELLDSLLVFSDSRMRRKTQKGFSDIEFHNYFKNVKQLLSQRFNGYEFEQKFDASDWKNRFTELKDIVQITSEEKDKLISEGKKKYKEYKGNFWSNLFGKKEEPVKALNEGVTANVVTQKELAEAFNKSIEVKGVSVKNGNKAKNKKRDINKDDKKSQDVK